LKVAVFLVVIPCSLAEVQRGCRLNDEVGLSETSAQVYLTTRRHNPENNSIFGR